MAQDLHIVTMFDATGSMESTITALKPALTQICQLMPLFVNAKFHLIIYRDFDCHGDQIYKHHGPFEATDMSKMIQIVNDTAPTGGGDTEECQKLAFGNLLNDIPSGNIIVFHFTDAPPHIFPFPQRGNDNHYKEGYKLRIDGLAQDWVPLCQAYKNRNIAVYTIGSTNSNYYTLMSHMTGGEHVLLNNAQSDTITKTITIVFSRALGYDECDLTNLASVIKLSNTSTLPASENSNGFRNLKQDTFKYTEGGQIVEFSKAEDVCTRVVLEQRYKTDQAYQKLCYTTFSKLIKDGFIQALTYNPLLGCLYRNMCRRSKLGPLETQRDELHKLISDTQGTLKTNNPQVFEEVSKWIENSYNRIEEINEIIMTVTGPIVPFLTLQLAERMTKKDLTLACKIPMPQNLRQLGNLVSNVLIEDKKPKSMPEVFVPLSMSNNELFALLSHLMCPGVKLDFKPSVVLALVTLNSGNVILAPRAKEFLQTCCGKWFNKDESEWHLFGFIKMVLRLHKEHNNIITDEENSYLTEMSKISAIKYNNFELDCERKFKLLPEHGKKYHDHKANCLNCNQFRSVSIITEKACGICLHYEQDKLNTLTDNDKAHSYLFDCTTCGSRYAVRNIDGLKAKPKCHYCRMAPPMQLDKIPKVVCSVCDIGMILPDKTKVNPATKFMCAICVENGGEERIETIQVKLHDIIAQNLDLMPYIIGMKLDISLLTGRESLFSLREKYKIETIDKYTKIIQYDKRPLLNTDEIITKIKDVIITGAVNTQSCIICYNDFIHHDLESLCYHKECKALACKPCIKNWFGENKPGKPVYENRIKCTTCKRVPIGGHAFMNPHLKSLISQKIEFDHDWHYAWCKTCGKVKEYMERVCAGVDPLDIINNNFICSDCMKPNGNKECPQCHMLVIKTAGCDNMTCPKERNGCGIHWCYRCEKDAFSSRDARDVYNHLNDIHGNIYGAPAEAGVVDVYADYDNDDD